MTDAQAEAAVVSLTETRAAAGLWRKPLLLLLSATMLFALGPAVLKLLTERSSAVGLATGSISFCNVLFVGNLCAGLVTLLIGRPRRTVIELTALARAPRRWLLLAAVVSTIYPALLFTALERTTVTNVVLLSRFNGIVFVLLAWLLLNEKVRIAQVTGYAVIALGVAILVLLNNSGLSIRTGDLLVLLAAVFFAFTELISRKVLPHVSIYAYVFFRNFVSAIIFFTIAMVLFGPHHFMEAFMGDLWVLMVVYAVFAIVLAQVLWLNATRALPTQTIADVNLLSPVFSIVFAFVLLGESPAPMQWLVMGILAVGMLLPRLWPGRQPETAPLLLSIDTSLTGR